MYKDYYLFTYYREPTFNIVVRYSYILVSAEIRQIEVELSHKVIIDVATYKNKGQIYETDAYRLCDPQNIQHRLKTENAKMFDNRQLFLNRIQYAKDRYKEVIK